MKFRKKPVVIEAEQFHLESTVWPKGVIYLTNGCHCTEGMYGPHVHTLEGPLKASDGDWIITGVNGEVYPCKPDIFAQTYEAVDE